MSILKYVDLFAGIGGFRLAAEATRLPGVSFEAAAACEIDEPCRLIYNLAFNREQQQELFIEDISKIRTNGTSLPDGARNLPPFDVIFAGFPCQPFSNVGGRTGLQDPRGALFHEIVRILRHYQPSFFVLENVQKISTIKRGELLNEMIAALEDANYHVHLWDLRADDYGLPQKRRRLFFCGVNKRRSRNKKPIGEPPPVPRSSWKYPTVWHLLERKMDPQHIVPAKSKETILRRNPLWMGDLQINRPIARPLTATMAKWHRANQDNYYSPTYISAQNPDPFVSPEVDPNSEPIRRITPLEGFRLQGFPDDFALYSETTTKSFTTTYRMIGNAVPVDLATAVIRHFIGEYL